MNPYVKKTREEYEDLESLIATLNFSAGTVASPDIIMSQVDIILQTVLFASALEGGLYYDGESSFLLEIVKYCDVLSEFNRKFGTALKKTVTWDNLIFLPAPGKRQMLEALRAEEQNAMTSLRGLLAGCGADVWKKIQGKLLRIAEEFAVIDIEQKGKAVAEGELAVSKRELDRLFDIT